MRLPREKHTTIGRLLRTLHAALGRLLAKADEPKSRKSRCSWFGCDPDALHATRPPDQVDEAAEARSRNTFWVGRPLP